MIPLIRRRAIIPEPYSKLPQDARRHIELPVGEILFQQDEVSRGLFFLLKGKLELRRFTAAGETVVTHHVVTGQTFAEASLFSPCYHCDAVARTTCQLIEFDRATVLSKIENDGSFALALTARFSHQIQSYRRRFEILAIKQAEERVFVAMSENLLEPGHDIKSFAAGIGLTHETVYRSLNSLVKKNRIEKTGRGSYQLSRA